MPDLPSANLELPTRLMWYQQKCWQEAPALQERYAEGGRAEVHSGAHMIVHELCYVAYV